MDWWIDFPYSNCYSPVDSKSRISTISILGGNYLCNCEKSCPLQVNQEHLTWKRFCRNGTGDIIDLSEKSQLEKDVEIANHTTSRVGWRTSWLFSRIVLNLILIGALVLMYFNWKNVTMYGYVLYCVIIISLLAEHSLMIIQSAKYSKHSTLKLMLTYDINFQNVEKGSEKEESLTKLLVKIESLMKSIISGNWQLD